MALTPAQVSLIGSAVNAGGGLITNFINRKNIKDTNEQRYKMFREQLQYNDASAQMQRQMAAGLHPMTLSGLQPTDAPTAPDFESYEARNPFSGAIDTGNNIASTMIQEKQLSLSERQLEVQHLQTTVDALNAVTALMGENATTEEALMMLNKITGLTPVDGLSVVSLHRDEVLLNSLKNQVELSNLSVEEKRILTSWLDEIKEAEYNLMVAQTGETGSRDRLNQINYKVSESIAKLNDAERSHVEQLTKNLQEQWKSLNFQGEFDANKLKHLRTITKAFIKELVNTAKLSEQEVTYWVWSKVINANASTLLIEEMYNSEGSFGSEYDYKAPYIPH